tara:strand:+ start:223 stop:408 length:186 start_codon:yes stop_codon:yes gene_type:complete
LFLLDLLPETTKSGGISSSFSCALEARSAQKQKAPGHPEAFFIPPWSNFDFDGIGKIEMPK